MVSLRCKMVVKSVLDNLKLQHHIVELGEVEIMKGHLSKEKHDKLKAALHKSGLELMDDERAIMVERIKNIIVEMVHYTDELPKVNFSVLLSEKLKRPYAKLSALFSEVKGVNIEHFILMHRIERVKELIIYNELNMSEIADKMNFSSLSHLSSAFRKVTGLTPSFFKAMKHKRRSMLENL